MSGLVHATAEHQPSDLAQVRDALLAARGEDSNVLIRGGGTKLTWGGRPSEERPWHVLDTRHLNALVRHDPGDMTAAVQAGMPLAALQASLAVAGQELGIDPPHRGADATVGGIFAANDSGPRRQRYGGIRDLVIGTTVVLADGTVSRSGGNVIKNVAGYDLSKLWCGSLGTLGLVVELTLRLHPLPASSSGLLVPAPPDLATELVLELLAAPVECSVLEWSTRAGGSLLVGFEGHPDGVRDRIRTITALVARHGRAVEAVDGGSSTWATWRDAHAGGPGETVARASSLPGDLARVAGGLAESASDTGVYADLHSHAGLGLHDAVLRGGDAKEQAGVVARWRERLRELGGSVVLRDRLPGLDQHVDPWGDGGPAILFRSIKASVDPESRYAPGRFVGGI